MKLLNVTFEESGKLLLLKPDGELAEIADVSESGINFKNSVKKNGVELALSGYGPGERLWDNMIKDPLDIGLKTGSYGLYSEHPGTINLPETFLVGYCQIVQFDSNWQHVIVHNMASKNTYDNHYNYNTNSWSGWRRQGNVTRISKADKNLFTSAGGEISGGGTVSAENFGGVDWHITAEVAYITNNPPETFAYGLERSVISNTIGKPVTINAYDLNNRWELYGPDGTLLLDKIAYGTTMEADNRHFRPARVHTVNADGTFGGGAWGLNALPSPGFYKFDFWAREA